MTFSIESHPNYNDAEKPPVYVDIETMRERLEANPLQVSFAKVAIKEVTGALAQAGVTKATVAWVLERVAQDLKQEEDY